MEFTLSVNALKTLARSITSFSRVGSDLSIQASPSQTFRMTWVAEQSILGRAASRAYSEEYGAELGIQIAAIYNEHLDFMEETLLQAIRDMYSYTGPANITSAPIMLIYTVVKNIWWKLIFEIGRPDIGLRFQFAYALISVALGFVACSLLIYILLGDMPWLILISCVLMLTIPFKFEPKD